MTDMPIIRDGVQSTDSARAAKGSPLKKFGAMLMADPALRKSGPPYLLADLTELQAETVRAAGWRQVVQRGVRLFSQGARQNGIYLIETGRIKVFYTAPSGRQITLAYWHPGNFVGGPEVFRRGVHMWSGAASANSTVLHLPGDDLRRLVTEIPTLAMNVMEGLIFKGKCYSALAQMLGTRSVSEKLAHLMLHLMDLYGVEEEDGIMIAAPFTHADLAHMTGVTRQGVSATLKQLADRGAITVRDTHILVLDAKVLTSMRDGTRSASTP